MRTLRYKYLIVSIAVLVSIVCVTLLLFFPSTNGLGQYFTVVIVYFYLTKAFLYIGAILLLLRLIRVVKPTPNFVYTLFSAGNAILGMLAIFLYYFDNADRQWLNGSLLNLLVGFLGLADIFLLSPNEHSEEKEGDNTNTSGSSPRR